ncbi:hypothetical protein OG2516_11896 [Oceanicola granulosus HTCC2516]|uniref:DUF2125 domain-containing protein n=1 Tax=Oceanicola granulosus (strain ATCC BAA-861 / DSM 15982 / KCTC 12143 / HTCC2516) TaxID=314256 RepID=Q2CJH4_OCEGH|nr:hypothetical protein [Oceanicola granulosus]EAR53165.1 hypothetical protein OG2516_11896 [Oceanicola granulosus HTCC2516]
MPRFAATITALPLAALCAGGALADVTPEEVWAIYETYTESFGIEVSAGSVRNGSALQLSDVTLTIPLPQDFGQIAATLPDMELVDQGDGTVRLVYPESMDMALTAKIGPPGEQLSGDATLSMTMAGQETTFSGTADSMVVESSLASFEMALTDLALRGDPDLEEIDESWVALTASGESISSTSNISQTGGMLTISTDSTTGPSAYRIALTGPNGENISETTGSSESGSSTAMMIVPTDGIDWLDMGGELRRGLSLTATSTSRGAVQSSSTGEAEFMQTDSTSRSESTTGAFSFSAAGLALGGAATGTTITYSVTPMMPFDIEASLDEISLQLALPLLTTETPQQAGLQIALDGLTVADQLWGLVDPAAILPRDPASMRFEISSEVRLLADVFDYEKILPMLDAEQMPLELGKVIIGALNASAAGVTLTSSGAFTFDFTDFDTFDGLPRIEGSASAEASGVNTLIDRLITMGLITEEDAMGGRMALGMFTTAAGNDVVTSTVEFTEDGGIVVNGMRMP